MPAISGIIGFAQGGMDRARAEAQAQREAQEEYERDNEGAAAVADLATPIPGKLEEGVKIGRAVGDAIGKALPGISSAINHAGQAAEGLSNLDTIKQKVEDGFHLYNAARDAGASQESSGLTAPQTPFSSSPDSYSAFPSTQVGPLDLSGMTPGAMPDSPFAGRFGVFGNRSLPSDGSMGESGPSFARPAAGPDSAVGVAGAKAQAAFDQSPSSSVNLTPPDYMTNTWTSPAGPKVYGDVNLDPDTYGGGYDPNTPVS